MPSPYQLNHHELNHHELNHHELHTGHLHMTSRYDMHSFFSDLLGENEFKKVDCDERLQW